MYVSAERSLCVVVGQRTGWRRRSGLGLGRLCSGRCSVCGRGLGGFLLGGFGFLLVLLLLEGSLELGLEVVKGVQSCEEGLVRDVV